MSGEETPLVVIKRSSFSSLDVDGGVEREGDGAASKLGPGNGGLGADGVLDNTTGGGGDGTGDGEGHVSAASVAVGNQVDASDLLVVVVEDVLDVGLAFAARGIRLAFGSLGNDEWNGKKKLTQRWHGQGRGRQCHHA